MAFVAAEDDPIINDPGPVDPFRIERTLSRGVPTVRGTTSRTTATGSPLSSRSTIGARVTGRTITSTPTTNGQPVIPNIDQDALTRILIKAGLPVSKETRDRLFPPEVPSTSGGGSTPSGNSTSPNGASGPIYGTGDPFSVLADLYLRTFGPDNPIVPTGQPSVIPVPVGASGGGSNSGSLLLILLILAGAGFGIYYFYFR